MPRESSRFGSLANAGSVLTGFTLAAYILGWTRFRSFMTSFGAPWIRSLSPVSAIVSNGGLPVVFLVVSYSISQYPIEDLYGRENTLRDIAFIGGASGRESGKVAFLQATSPPLDINAPRTICDGPIYGFSHTASVSICKVCIVL